MQKIILDTNVIVSALLSNGIPSQIINELVLERKVLAVYVHSIVSLLSQNVISFCTSKLDFSLLLLACLLVADKPMAKVKLNSEYKFKNTELTQFFPMNWKNLR